MEHRNLKLPFINNNYYKNQYLHRNVKYLKNFPNTTYNSQLNTYSNIDSSFLNKNNPRRIHSFIKQHSKSINNLPISLILDLRNTLHSSERIKNKILNKNKSFNNSRKLKQNKIIKSNNNNSKMSKSFMYNNSFEENNNFSYNKNYEIEEMNKDYFEQEKFKNKNQEKEIIKLNNLNNALMEINLLIKKENLILERELSNYKTQFINYKSIYNNRYYNNISSKEFQNLKSTLQSSLNENDKILKKICKIQEMNNSLNKNIKKLFSKNENFFKKIESINRENAEIQILNEENEKKYNDLKEKNDIFKNEIKRLKFELIQIKNKNNNLKLLKDSNMNKLVDFEEIIRNLNYNKNILENELNNKSDKMNDKAELLHKHNQYMYFYKNKINNLQNILKKLSLEKEKILQKNLKIQNISNNSTTPNNKNLN